MTAYKIEYETAYEERPVTTYKPIWETQMREERYTVAKPVTETSEREEVYTVQKPVWETQMRDNSYTRIRYVQETAEREERYTVNRPITETAEREEAYTVLKPVYETSVPHRNLHGNAAADRMPNADGRSRRFYRSDSDEARSAGHSAAMDGGHVCGRSGHGPDGLSTCRAILGASSPHHLRSAKSLAAECRSAAGSADILWCRKWNRARCRCKPCATSRSE